MGGHLAPGNVNGQNQRNIGQECQCQPLEIAHVALVRKEHLQQQAGDAEDHAVDVRGSSHDEMQRIAHRGDVGRDVDRIGDDQQADDGIEHAARELSSDVGSEPMARHAADTGAHELDAHHQRIGEDDRPEGEEAELGTGLGIGGDAGRIVVGCSGDEPGAKLAYPIADRFSHHSCSPPVARRV